MGSGPQSNASFATDGKREADGPNVCDEPLELTYIDPNATSDPAAELRGEPQPGDAQMSSPASAQGVSAESDTSRAGPVSSQPAGGGTSSGGPMSSTGLVSSQSGTADSGAGNATFAQRPGSEPGMDRGKQAGELAGGSTANEKGEANQQQSSKESPEALREARYAEQQELARAEAEQLYLEIHLELKERQEILAAGFDKSEKLMRQEMEALGDSLPTLAQRYETRLQQLDSERQQFRAHLDRIDTTFQLHLMGQSHEDGSHSGAPVDLMAERWRLQSAALDTDIQFGLGRWPGHEAGAAAISPEVQGQLRLRFLDSVVPEEEQEKHYTEALTSWFTEAAAGTYFEFPAGVARRLFELGADYAPLNLYARYQEAKDMMEAIDAFMAQPGDKSVFLNDLLNPVSQGRDTTDAMGDAAADEDWETLGALSVDFAVILAETLLAGKVVAKGARAPRVRKPKGPKKLKGEDLDGSGNNQNNRSEKDGKTGEQGDAQNDTGNGGKADSDTPDGDEGPPPENSTAATPEERAREDYQAALDSDYGGKFSEAEFINRYSKGQYFDLQARTWRKNDSDKLPDGISFADAFDDLTHETVFGRYFNKLETSGLFKGSNLRQILERVGFAGRRRGDVRRDFRNEVEPQLLEHLKDKESLQQDYPELDWKGDPDGAFQQASHKRFLDFTEGLGGNDRGRLAEKWYRSLYAAGSATQISIPAKILNRLRGKPNKHGRRADMVDADGTLREIKHGSGKLSKRDKDQFKDYMLVLREEAELTDPRLSKSPIGKETLQIKKAVFTFADPNGAKANLEWMARELTRNDNLIFEVFDGEGVKHKISHQNVQTLQSLNFDY